MSVQFIHENSGDYFHTPNKVVHYYLFIRFYKYTARFFQIRKTDHIVGITIISSFFKEVWCFSK